MTKRALVLGGTGFLGRALCEQLSARGFEVQRFGSGDLDLRRTGASAELGTALEGVAVLVVASTRTPPVANTLVGLNENLAIITNIAKALETAALRHCVYLSSEAVYGWKHNPVDESTPVEPASHYAIAHYAGERILQVIADARGFSLLALRPVAVFGPGDSHNAYGPNRFVRSIVAERRVTAFGRGDDVRDHLYVADFARLAVLLLENGATGIYNLASGVGRTFASIVEDLRRLAPDGLEIARMPRAIPLTHRTFDNTRLLAAAPAFRFTPFEVALRATLDAAARADLQD